MEEKFYDETLYVDLTSRQNGSVDMIQRIEWLARKSLRLSDLRQIIYYETRIQCFPFIRLNECQGKV